MRTENGLPVRGISGVKKGAAATAARNASIRICWLGAVEKPRKIAEPDRAEVKDGHGPSGRP